MTTIFDRYLVMSNKDGVTEVDLTLDKLDEMLNTYGVKHSFTLPHSVIIEKYPNAVITLNYNNEDDMLLSLVYALFLKMHRGADDNLLGKALAKEASHYNYPVCEKVEAKSLSEKQEVVA
jgi:hypothetical protein